MVASSSNLAGNIEISVLSAIELYPFVLKYDIGLRPLLEEIVMGHLDVLSAGPALVMCCHPEMKRKNEFKDLLTERLPSKLTPQFS